MLTETLKITGKGDLIMNNNIFTKLRQKINSYRVLHSCSSVKNTKRNSDIKMWGKDH